MTQPSNADETAKPSPAGPAPGDAPRWAPPDALPETSDETAAPPPASSPASSPADPPAGSPADPPPAPPAPVPWHPPAPGGRPRANRYALVALLTGLFGMVLFAIGFGIAALVQISRRGERGKGMAIGGLAAAAAWTAGGTIVAAVSFGTAVGDAAEESSLALYPKAGQCFDFVGADDAAELKVMPCTEPHQAEMVLRFTMPKGPFPGDQEVQRRGDAECERRFQARFKTKAPLDNSAAHAVVPTRIGWRLGDRGVHCAVVAALETSPLTQPIGSGPWNHRALDELRVGDCFIKARDETFTVELTECGDPHNGQLTHRFELPAGAYPGDHAAEKKAEQGCEARWKEIRAERKPPVPIQPWHWNPTKETWAEGDRLVLCYVTDARDRDLTRSVLPS
ncbi:septum formation family protein [Spirillospora sp. NPDC029432]|uniref:DUF4190 domain-containing protein n=1 Tax=Spirillospora sp. NPDC029432 TaxID=3154599 RepID=UPI003455329E